MLGGLRIAPGDLCFTAVLGVLVGWASLAVALLAIRRRPRIRAGMFAEDTDVGYYEGYEVDVTVGRRPLEVDEIGLLVLYGPRGRRRRLHLRGRPNRPLPAHLSDGQRVSTSFGTRRAHRPTLVEYRRRGAPAKQATSLCTRKRSRVSRAGQSRSVERPSPRPCGPLFVAPGVDAKPSPFVSSSRPKVCSAEQNPMA